MAGTYRQLKNGKWELCCSLGFGIDGKRKREYRYIEASGPREVEKALAEFVTECNRSRYVDGGKMKLAEYIDLWLQDYVRKNLKRKTIDDYKEKSIRIKDLLGHLKMKDLKPTHLIQFYDYLQQPEARKDKRKNGEEHTTGLSYSSMAHYHRILSSMLQDAVEWQIIKENICKNVRPPKQKRELRKNKKPKAFTLAETKMFLEALNDEPMKYKVAAVLGIFMGVRRGELLGIEWKDIDWKEYTIDINKASYYTPEEGIYEDTTKTEESERRIHVPKSVIVMLKNYKVYWNTIRALAHDKWIETDRLFVQKHGHPMAPATITKWFKEFVSRHQEFPSIAFHGLRHTHGSILLYMGMDIESVASQMGHNTIKMLIETYGHDVKKSGQEVSQKMGTALLTEENEDENGPENKTAGTR